MPLTTLAELRDRCKDESDNVNFGFITDATWNTWIRSSFQDLYGQITQAFGNDYFVQTPSTGYTFTTNGTSSYFPLPTDFFKMLGVDLQISAPNQWVSLKPFNFSERNRLSVTNSLVPMAGQTIRLLYIPLPTLPDEDTDTIDGVNGWEEFIIIDCCIKAMLKGEEDPSGFFARRSMMVERLNAEMENRDAGSPPTVADVLGRRARAMQYRINGSQLWLIGNGMPGYGPWGDWSDANEGWGW